MTAKDEKISQLTVDVERLMEEVEVLMKTVLRGNGQPSIVSQTIELHNKLKGLETTISDKFYFMNREMSLKFDNLTTSLDSQVSMLTDAINRSFERKQTEQAGKWEVRAAFISAGFAVVIAIITFVLSKI
jgi:hypothetical protein